MQCEYFGKCGSCTLHTYSYSEQLEKKIKQTKERFSSFYKGDLDVVESAPSHFRARKEFKIWHEGDEFFYAMSKAEKNGVICIEACEIVNRAIYTLMPKLKEALKPIHERLFGVEFLSASTGDMVVSLLYHKKLDSVWEEKARLIASELGISIIGRSRKQKVVVGNDFVIEKLFIKDEEYQYKYIENSFTQPNTYVNKKMIEWALEKATRSRGDLLELYCGCGNFTIAFAKYFNKVLATEISKSSIRAANENVALNGVDNITFIRMSSEEFVQAMNKEREFTRLKDVNLDDFNVETIFVDPPRSGLDDTTRSLCSRYNDIIYISCNPESLYRDLETLCKTHRVENVAVFDQFAYTSHLEMGVYLKRF